MSLTAKDVADITRLLEESAFDELELELNGMKIHLRRTGAMSAAPRAVPGASAPAQSPGQPAAKPAALGPGLTPVRAPLLGTFYRAPKPGAPPFVDVGATVEPDTIVGIIEVMKLMNTVRAGVHGVVREIPARDGVLVEFGETLLVLAPREAR